jgi:DNA invertase Pin-like site-specific DNA recombinase
VVVWKLDSMGRSLAHLVELVDRWFREGIEFRSLMEGMDGNRTHPGRLSSAPQRF